MRKVVKDCNRRVSIEQADSGEIFIATLGSGLEQKQYILRRTHSNKYHWVRVNTPARFLSPDIGRIRGTFKHCLEEMIDRGGEVLQCGTWWEALNFLQDRAWKVEAEIDGQDTIAVDTLDYTKGQCASES